MFGLSERTTMILQAFLGISILCLIVYGAMAYFFNDSKKSGSSGGSSKKKSGSSSSSSTDGNSSDDDNESSDDEGGDSGSWNSKNSLGSKSFKQSSDNSAREHVELSTKKTEVKIKHVPTHIEIKKAPKTISIVSATPLTKKIEFVTYDKHSAVMFRGLLQVKDANFELEIKTKGVKPIVNAVPKTTNNGVATLSIEPRDGSTHIKFATFDFLAFHNSTVAYIEILAAEKKYNS